MRDMKNFNFNQNEVKNILFLDIDQVLNGTIDWEEKSQLNDLYRKEQDPVKKEKYLNIRKEKYPYCEIGFDHKKDGNIKYEAIGFVSKEKLTKLQNIIKKYNVEVIGISSWFIHEFEKNKKDFEKFFGFEIVDVAGLTLVSGVRLRGAYNYLKTWYADNPYKNINVVYLDDLDDFFDKDYTGEYKKMHTEMIKTFNTLFIHPRGKTGLIQEEFGAISKHYK